jgi:hypothetical protein
VFVENVGVVAAGDDSLSARPSANTETFALLNGVAYHDEYFDRNLRRPRLTIVRLPQRLTGAPVDDRLGPPSVCFKRRWRSTVGTAGRLLSLDRGQHLRRARAEVPEELAPEVAGLAQPRDEKVPSVPGVMAVVEIGDRTPYHGRRQQDPGVVSARP